MPPWWSAPPAACRLVTALPFACETVQILITDGDNGVMLSGTDFVTVTGVETQFSKKRSVLSGLQLCMHKLARPQVCEGERRRWSAVQALSHLSYCGLHSPVALTQQL